MFTRMKQGWELTKKAWSVVRSNPGLAKLPLTGGVLAIIAALVLAGPGLFLTSADQDATRYVGFFLIALGSYAASFIVIYYNVILAGAANDALDGREPDVAAARQVAKNRIPTIAGWALVSALVSVALSVLRDRGGIAGQIAASLGAALWGLVTFLVIPVVALEGIGPIEAIKRSGSLVKNRWGQQVTGNFVIGGISTHGLDPRRRRSDRWRCADRERIRVGRPRRGTGRPRPRHRRRRRRVRRRDPRRLRRGALPLRRRGPCRRAVHRRRTRQRRSTPTVTPLGNRAQRPAPSRLSRATSTSITSSGLRSVSPRRSLSALASSWIARWTPPPASRR